MEEVEFRRFDESTQEEWDMLNRRWAAHERGLVDRIIAALDRLKGDKLGYRVDRYEHSLQTASRALRAGADEETVVCALLHDIGDDLAPYNHGAFAANVLRPYVGAENYWMVAHHEIFQGYHYFQFMGRDRMERERYRGHPAFARTVRFCDEWDQTAFDPAYPTLKLSEFEPALRRIFARPAPAIPETAIPETAVA
jgi:predicted HD phosphohydrolase